MGVGYDGCGNVAGEGGDGVDVVGDVFGVDLHVAHGAVGWRMSEVIDDMCMSTGLTDCDVACCEAVGLQSWNIAIAP